MLDQDFARYQDVIVATAVDVGGKVLAAIVFWIVGRWLIRLATSMARGGLEKHTSPMSVAQGPRPYYHACSCNIGHRVPFDPVAAVPGSHTLHGT